jgi:hypothetical protein
MQERRLPVIKVFRAILVLGFLSALLGFSSKFDIIVSQEKEGCPKFIFQRSFWRSVELNQFTVVKKLDSDWDHKHPVWEIHLKPGSALRVDTLVYGVTPSAFLSDQPAQELDSGVLYLAYASSSGMVGSSTFIAPEPGRCLINHNEKY